MIHSFEVKRVEVLKKKIKNSVLIVGISSGIAIILFLLAITENTDYFWFLIPVLLIIIRVCYTTIRAIQIKQDIQKSTLYKEILKFGPSYEAVVNQISEELDGCNLYSGCYTYITKNWILDFTSIDVKLTYIPSIVWLYGVRHGGATYVKCHLDDARVTTIKLSAINQIIAKIKEEHPNILFGYSNKIEMLMNSNQEVFIRNIKAKKFPTREGQWEA